MYTRDKARDCTDVGMPSLAAWIDTDTGKTFYTDIDDDLTAGNVQLFLPIVPRCWHRCVETAITG